MSEVYAPIIIVGNENFKINSSGTLLIFLMPEALGSNECNYISPLS